VNFVSFRAPANKFTREQLLPNNRRQILSDQIVRHHRQRAPGDLDGKAEQKQIGAAFLVDEERPRNWEFEAGGLDSMIRSHTSKDLRVK